MALSHFRRACAEVHSKIIQLEWIAKWDGSLPTYMLGNSNGVILNLDQNKDK